MVAPGPAEAGFPTLSANTGGQGWGTRCARDDRVEERGAFVSPTLCANTRRKGWGTRGLRLPLTMFGVAQDDTRAVAVLIRHARRRGVDVLGTQAVKQRLLLSGEEAQLQPAEDVIHDGLGVANVLVTAPAAGLEAGVRKLFAHQLERHAVLQGQRRGAGEAIHQAADGRAFLGHGDEDLA